MQQLTDFLNHGLLPFTGRGRDVERLLEFWRGSFDAQELRTALLVGEAGMGKSRLLDETLPRIIDAGGCVVHAKLVPESTTSIVPLVTRGLLYSEATRRIIRERPGPTMADAIGLLRRVSRLFPTLLVLEDIHLIAGEMLRELATLLEAVADEKLSLLCLSRPVDLPARAVIERSIVEEIELAGLDAAEIAGLWCRLFNAEPEPGMAEQLRELTGGNPLALRSTLRGAIASRAIVSGGSGRWHLTLDREAFLLVLRRNVDLLVEGMAAHLTGPERHTAVALAALGEVFAGETAEALAGAIPGGDIRETIRSLTFKGILAPASTVAPLLGAMTTLPHTFTHTLLHQHLVAEGEPPVEALIGAIADGRPVYSALPFRLISGRPVPPMVPAEILASAVERTIDGAYQLDVGADWRLALELLATGWHMFRAIEHRMDDLRKDLLEASLLLCALSLRRRSPGGEEFARDLRRLLEITASRDDERMLPLRLRALRHEHVAACTSDYGACVGITDRVDELVDAHPHLMHSTAYLRFLEQMARAAQGVADEEMLRRVETRLDRLLASPELSDSLRAYAHERVAASLLLLFDSAAELDRRLALAGQTTARVDGQNALLAINRVTLLQMVGRMDEALEVATRTAEHFHGIGLAQNAAHAELIALSARAALENDLTAIERDAARLASSVRGPAAASFSRNVGIYLGRIGLLRGEPEWTARIDAASGGAVFSFWPEGRLLTAAGEADLCRAIEELPAGHQPTLALRELGAALMAHDVDTRSIALATSLLTRPLLRLEDLLRLRAALAMVDGPLGASMAPLVIEEMRHAMLTTLEWLQERRLGHMMSALLERHRDLLARKEMSAWRSRVKAMAEERRTAEAPAGSTMRVSMLGTITVIGRDGEARPLRGARARTMLGLLVAAEMVRVPLTRREFTAIASGEEDDAELAKKTTVMAAARLRETIDPGAVITGEPMYRLDLAQVSVDLLDAHARIEETRRALRRGALQQASVAMLAALRLTRGEVPFPGLYDSFFETVRDDFESRLRTTVIDLAGLLLRESEAEMAEKLLRDAFDRMRDDEEIAALLEEALAATGHQGDSLRVGRLVKESVG